MNIFFYEASSGFGGSASALAYLVNYLDRDKFSPIIGAANFGTKIEKINSAQFIKLKPNPETKSLSTFQFLFCIITYYLPEVFKLYFIIKKRNISLVHINTNIISGIPAILASWISGVPCICHIRETRKLIKRERIFAKLIDKVITLNTDAYDIYKCDIPESKITVVYDGIALDEFTRVNSATFKGEYNLDSVVLVGTAGRIVEGKGQKEFVLAAQEVLKVKSGVRFVIVGDAKAATDKYYKDTKKLALNCIFNKNIIFTGWRTDIRNIISAFDIFVFTSTTYAEGLPNSIIEAMALSKPVVSTNIPGPYDIVIDGVTGFLVPPGDIDAMAEKIIYFLEHPDIARKMGNEGKKRAEELFDIKKQIKKIEAIYEDVLSVRR